MAERRGVTVQFCGLTWGLTGDYTPGEPSKGVASAHDNDDFELLEVFVEGCGKNLLDLADSVRYDQLRLSSHLIVLALEAIHRED